jgi:hypothetical protein
MGKLSGQYAAVLFAGYDISGRSRQFDLSVEYIQEDATGFQDGAENSQAGLAMFDGSVTAFMDPATGNSWDALKSPASHTGQHLMVLFGEGGTPTVGDAAMAAAAEQFQINLSGNPQDKLVLTANFKPESTGAFRPDFCRVLIYDTITVTTTTASYNTGAGPWLDGGTGYLQVFTAPATDTYSIVIEDSPNDSTWATYITFTLDGSAIGSERIVDATSLDQWWRVVATRTGAAAQDFGLAVVLRKTTDRLV